MTRISHPDLPDVDLGCCGARLVKINNGGLYSEGEWNPNTQQVYDVESILWKPYSLPSGCKSSELMVSSPLGWVNLTPLEIRDAKDRCPTLGELIIAQARLEPLINHRFSTACATNAPRRSKPEIGPYSLGTGWEPIHAGSLEAFRRGQTLLAGIPGTRAYVALSEEITVSSPHFEHIISILGPGTFYTKNSVSIEVEALAITVAGPLGALSFASASGLVASVAPGRIKVSSSGRVRLALGGPLVAAKLLHEDAVVLSPEESCGRGLGHVRSYNTILLMTGFDGRYLEAIWYSPVADGSAEIRAYAPLRSAIIEELGSRSEIPVAGDLVRVPAPFGSCGKVRVEYGGSIFFRLRRKEG